MKKVIKGDRVGYFYILPALLFMFLFIFFPVIYNTIISLQDVTVSTLISNNREFVGLANYVAIFKSKEFAGSLSVTIIFTVACISFQFLIGFLLALIFKKRTRSFQMMKAIMMIPYIIPATVNAILWKFFFATKGGIINETLLALGFIKDRIEWLDQPATAVFSIIAANIWCGIPFFMILLSTGLANVPKDFYESARIDGANTLQRLFYITIPNIRTSIEASLVLGIVYTFRCYELVYVMTAGGPVNSTELLTLYSYKYSFVTYNFSQGAAISNILLLILLFVGLAYIKLMDKDEVM